MNKSYIIFLGTINIIQLWHFFIFSLDIFLKTLIFCDILSQFCPYYLQNRISHLLYYTIYFHIRKYIMYFYHYYYDIILLSVSYALDQKKYRPILRDSILNNCKFIFYSSLPQHFLYFLPLPQGHGSFLPIFLPFLTVLLAVSVPSDEV